MLKNQYIQKRCNEIETLLQYADSWAKQDEKLGAHLAAYTCVLFLGVLEDCLEHLIADWAKNAIEPKKRQRLVALTARRLRNPNFKNICEALDLCGKDYKVRFSQRIKPDGHESETLSDIVRNKTNIAHAGTNKLNLSVRDMNDYYRRVTPILEAVEDILAE